MGRTVFGMIFVASAFALSCSSSSTLKYVIANETLADVSEGEKGAMFEALNGATKAQDEVLRTRHEQLVAQKGVEVADSEYAIAGAELEKAEAAHDVVKASNQEAEIKASQARLEVLKLAKDVADVSRDLMKEKRELADLRAEAATKHVLAEQARAELAKAQIAVARSKTPADGFDAKDYESQSTEAQRTYEKARVKADEQQVEVTELENKYNEKKRELDAKKQPAQP